MPVGCQRGAHHQPLVLGSVWAEQGTRSRWSVGWSAAAAGLGSVMRHCERQHLLSGELYAVGLTSMLGQPLRAVVGSP